MSEETEIKQLQADVDALKALLRDLCDALTADPLTRINYNAIASKHLDRAESTTKREVIQ